MVSPRCVCKRIRAGWLLDGGGGCGGPYSREQISQGEGPPLPLPPRPRWCVCGRSAGSPRLISPSPRRISPPADRAGTRANHLAPWSAWRGCLTSATSVCGCGPGPGQRAEGDGRPGFSEIWTQRSPLHGGRAKRTKAWGLAAPGNQAAGGGDRRAVRRARDGGESRLREAGGRHQVLSAVRDGSVVERADKVRVSKRSSSDQDCANRKTVSWVGEITWIFRLNPRARACRVCRGETRELPRMRASRAGSGGILGRFGFRPPAQQEAGRMTRRVCCCFPPLSPLSRRAAYVGFLVVRDVLQTARG